VDGFDQGIVRFCFAKEEDTLHRALHRLQKLEHPKTHITP
jgi:methionine aminotransferase